MTLPQLPMLAGGAVALSLALLAVPAMASPIEGTWRTQNGTEVTIAPCATGYCGTLTWVVIPKDFAAQCSQDKAAFGAQMVDTRNADAHLRTRPIVGMQMLSVKPTSDIRTFTASIYNAEDGKTYDGVIWVVNGDSVLRLGGGCLGQICVVTQDWPRVATRENTPDFTCTGN